MAFCSLGKDYIKEGYTQIDNLFLGAYLPAADAVDCKVYLYGLMLAAEGGDGNTLERMSMALKLTEDRIIRAFGYWEEQGLLTIGKTHPLKITYHSVKAPLTPAVKINAGEYSVFVEEMARLFPEKVLSHNEIMAFIETMRQYKIEVNAMLMITKYCMDIKGAASTPYVLAVASDWARQGITSEEDVTAHIEELERNNEDIRSILRTLGVKSEAGLEDRQLYLKWTKEYGYRMDAILAAARSLKRKGGMGRLSKTLDELKNAGALSAREVSDYLKNKEDNIGLSSDIVRMLGTYYSSYDMIIETYLSPWQAKGFDGGAIRTIAKYCFIKNIKTLDGMNGVVDRFYRLGILTTEGVERYMERQAEIDKLIKEVLEKAESQAFISARDREFYKTFVEVWGFDHQIILLAAEYSAGKPFPMANINRTLALLKDNGISAPEDAERFIKGLKDRTTKPQADGGYLKQNYTKAQLDSVFIDLSDEKTEETEL